MLAHYEKMVFPVAQRQKLVACDTQVLLEQSSDHESLVISVYQTIAQIVMLVIAGCYEAQSHSVISGFDF